MGFYEGCSPADLDLWIQNDANVLFEGLHGVGKTAMVRAAFARNLGETYTDKSGIERTRPGIMNRDWLYFSAPTIDPWVDFVGVPRVSKMTVDDIEQEYLGIVRPEFMVRCQPKAIFIDELNRAPKKVRNAVMELIQFGSINGHKFEQLKCVWASINPEDDPNATFDVEPLDPALRDRFHIQINIPFSPDEAYLADKYTPENARAAVAWWKTLTPDIALKVSPRRLDNAMLMHQRGINIRHMLPKESNPPRLIDMLKRGMPEEKFRKILAAKDPSEMRRFLAKTNNFEYVQRFIVNEPDARAFCLTLLDGERLSMLISKHPEVKKEMLSHPAEHIELLQELARGAQNERLKNECERVLRAIDRMEDGGASTSNLASKLGLKPLDAPAKTVKWLKESFEIASKAIGIESYSNVDGSSAVQVFEGSIDDEIRQIAYFCQLDCSNAFYRQQLVERLSRLVARPDISKNQVECCMYLCEFFAMQSSYLKVASYPLFMLVINSSISKYMAFEPKTTIADLFGIMPHVFARYFAEPINREDSKFKVVFDELIIKPKKDCLLPLDTTLAHLTI